MEGDLTLRLNFRLLLLRLLSNFPPVLNNILKEFNLLAIERESLSITLNIIFST